MIEVELQDGYVSLIPSCQWTKIHERVVIVFALGLRTSNGTNGTPAGAGHGAVSKSVEGGKEWRQDCARRAAPGPASPARGPCPI